MCFNTDNLLFIFKFIWILNGSFELTYSLIQCEYNMT